MPQWMGFHSSKDKEEKLAPKQLKRLVGGAHNKGSSSSLPITATATNNDSNNHDNNGINGRASPSPSLRSLSRLNLKSSPSLLSEKESIEDTRMMEDILQVRRALDYFLDSRIKEAEEILVPKRKTSMYYSLGYGFILFLKSAMTFEQTDVEKTMEALKHTIHLASAQQKKGVGFLDNITTWVKGNQIQQLKTMSRIQRHAVSSSISSS